MIDKQWVTGVFRLFMIQLKSTLYLIITIVIDFLLSGFSEIKVFIN